jgi:hypothetical protein
MTARLLAFVAGAMLLLATVGCNLFGPSESFDGRLGAAASPHAPEPRPEGRQSFAGREMLSAGVREAGKMSDQGT